MKHQKSLLCLAVALALSACGGGGGAGTASSSSATGSPSDTLLSGKVVDGYIEGAEVCLDINGDKACDTEKVKTDADGDYTLQTTFSSTVLANTHILVSVPKTAKDADDGGKTLEDTGKQPFQLLSPASNPEVVSPLTTLVSAEMITNGTSPSDAEKSIRSALGIDAGKSLLGKEGDFVAKQDDTLRPLAQVATVLLGEVKAKVTATVGSSTDKPKTSEQLLLELHTTKKLLQQLKLQEVKTHTNGKVDIALLKTQLTSGVLKQELEKLDTIEEIKSEVLAIKPPSAGLDISSMFADDTYIVSVDSNRNEVEVCQEKFSNEGAATLTCYETKKQDNSDTWGAWVAQDSQNYYLNGDQWQKTDEAMDRYELTENKQVVLIHDDDYPSTASWRVMLRSKGLPVYDGVSFSAGDLAYSVSITPVTNFRETKFWPDSPACSWRMDYSSQPPVSKPCTSFDDLKSFIGLASGNYFTANNATVGISFDGDQLAFSEIVKDNQGFFVKGTKISNASYSIETKIDSRIMRINVPGSLRSAVGLDGDDEMIFVEYKGVVYHGRVSSQFSIIEDWYNASAALKVLKKLGINNFPSLK